MGLMVQAKRQGEREKWQRHRADRNKWIQTAGDGFRQLNGSTLQVCSLFFSWSVKLVPGNRSSVCVSERKRGRDKATEREMEARGGVARNGAKTRHFSARKSLKGHLLLNGWLSVQSQR